jgi:RNA binding exosome subunit
MHSLVLVHSVRISTIAHATEGPERVAQAIRNLYLAEPSMSVATSRAKGHHGNEIVTMAYTIKSAKTADGFLQNIWNGLSSLDRTEVYSSLSSRIDSGGTLFLRIDKQEAVKGKIRLENTDPIKIAISFKTKAMKGGRLADEIRKRLEEIQR